MCFRHSCHSCDFLSLMSVALDVRLFLFDNYLSVLFYFVSLLFCTRFIILRVRIVILIEFMDLIMSFSTGCFVLRDRLMRNAKTTGCATFLFSDYHWAVLFCYVACAFVQDLLFPELRLWLVEFTDFVMSSSSRGCVACDRLMRHPTSLDGRLCLFLQTTFL